MLSLHETLAHQVPNQQPMMFYDDFQGDIGPPGPSGLTGHPGAGIQGEKVGHFFPPTVTEKNMLHILCG